MRVVTKVEITTAIKVVHGQSYKLYQSDWTRPFVVYVSMLGGAKMGIRQEAEKIDWESADPILPH